jgi:transcriptional regulator NrdR family protein
MTAYSNGMKMRRQAKELSARLTTIEVALAESNALIRATTSCYELLRKRSKLVKGNKSSETSYKIEQITKKIAGLKKEMKARRQNLQSIVPF